MGLHEINLSPVADFLIDKRFTFEVGGKSKMKKQIIGIPDAYLAKDGIEIGFSNVISVWIFGFFILNFPCIC